MGGKFVESRLEFTFDASWTVVPWDKAALYRDSLAFGSMSKTRACDFVARHDTDGVHLIEVKNFTEHHHDNREKLVDDAWFQSLAEKVRDTLASIVWARSRPYDTPPVKDLIDGALDGWLSSQPTLKVVVWIEDRPTLSVPASQAITRGLRQRLLRWFKIRQVFVTSTELNRAAPIPGLTVRAE